MSKFASEEMTTMEELKDVVDDQQQDRSLNFSLEFWDVLSARSTLPSGGRNVSSRCSSC